LVSDVARLIAGVTENVKGYFFTFFEGSVLTIRLRRGYGAAGEIRMANAQASLTTNEHESGRGD